MQTATLLTSLFCLFLLWRLNVTQQELAAKLADLGTLVGKIGEETAASLVLIQSLKDAITANPVAPEVEAAVAALETQLKATDDLIPDAPPPTV